MTLIPSETGLGGGSLEVIATLVGCNILWKFGLREHELTSIAALINEDDLSLVKGVMTKGVGHKGPLRHNAGIDILSDTLREEGSNVTE